MQGKAEKTDGQKRVQQSWHPEGCLHEPMKQGHYAALLYGCPDFSIAKIKRTNFLAAWESATL